MPISDIGPDGVLETVGPWIKLNCIYILYELHSILFLHKKTLNFKFIPSMYLFVKRLKRIILLVKRTQRNDPEWVRPTAYKINWVSNRFICTNWCIPILYVPTDMTLILSQCKALYSVRHGVVICCFSFTNFSIKTEKEPFGKKVAFLWGNNIGVHWLERRCGIILCC